MDGSFAPVPRPMLHKLVEFIPYMSKMEIAVFLYHINQQYNFTDKNTGYTLPKVGDNASYKLIARKTGCSDKTAIDACNGLVERKMIFKGDTYGKFGNHWDINEDTDQWIPLTAHAAGLKRHKGKGI